LLVGLSFSTVAAGIAQQSEEIPNSSPSKPDSWKFFRGEKFDGTSHSTGIADAWDAKGPPILWTIDLGVGYSGFVGAGDRIYTQYQSLTGQFVICLNAKTGQKIWEHRYAWPYKPASLYIERSRCCSMISMLPLPTQLRPVDVRIFS